jgi:hypothetical protein
MKQIDKCNKCLRARWKGDPCKLCNPNAKKRFTPKADPCETLVDKMDKVRCYLDQKYSPKYVKSKLGGGFYAIARDIEKGEL